MEDLKIEIVKAVVKYDELVLILRKTMENFECYSMFLAKKIESALNGNPNIEKVCEFFNQWCTYWMAVRDEWSLAYIGVIVNESQEKDVYPFYEKKKRFEVAVDDNNKYLGLDKVLCSSFGIRLWQLRYQNLGDWVDEKYPHLTDQTTELDQIAVRIDDCYLALFHMFNKSSKASLEPEVFQRTCQDELVKLRIKDTEKVISGYEIRSANSPQMRSSFVGDFAQKEVCGSNGKDKCSNRPCGGCGLFMSFGDIVDFVRKEQAKKKKLELEAQIIEKSKLEKLDRQDELYQAKLRGRIRIADIYLQEQMPSLRRDKSKDKFYNLFQVVYQGLLVSGTSNARIRFESTEKKFYLLTTKEMKNAEVLFQRHFQRLVLAEHTSYLETEKFLGLSLLDYIEDRCTRGLHNNFAFGDEFCLKVLASIFGFEASVLMAIPGQPLRSVAFSAFPEFGRSETSLSLVYYGDDKYHLCQRSPLRAEKIAFSPAEEALLLSVVIVEGFYDVDTPDLNASVMTLVDDLSKDDTEAKDELDLVVRSNSKSCEADCIKLGDLVYSEPKEGVEVRVPDIKDMFRNFNTGIGSDNPFQNPQRDPFENLCNAINFACEAKIFISYLLATAVIAVYFDKNSGDKFRDHIDWLHYIECIKLFQVNKWLKTNKKLFTSEIRALRAEIKRLEEDGEDLITFQKTLSDSDNSIGQLEIAQQKLKDLQAASAAQTDSWDRFKNGLNRILWEIVCELWRIWFALTRLSEDEKQAFLKTSDTQFIKAAGVEATGSTIKSLIHYTNNSEMEGFHALITTYKDVYNSRKTNDLPKNNADAFSQHEKMKIKLEKLQQLNELNVNDNKRKVGSYHATADDGDGGYSKRRKPDKTKKTFEIANEENDVPDEIVELKQGKTRSESRKVESQVETNTSDEVEEESDEELLFKDINDNNTPQVSKPVKTFDAEQERIKMIVDVFGADSSDEERTDNEGQDINSSIISNGSSKFFDMSPISLSGQSQKKSVQFDNDVSLFDSWASLKKGLMFLHLKYPAPALDGHFVLSFRFGIIAIIHASLGIESHEYKFLKLASKNVSDLLTTCVNGVKCILCAKGNAKFYEGDWNRAFDLLREKHILSVITKVLLLPLIVCWFPETQKDGVQLVMRMRTPPLEKSSVKLNVMVRIVTCQTGIGRDMVDIELIDPAKDRGCIDYFW